MCDGRSADARDETMEPELKGYEGLRSANLYADPISVAEVYGYDAVGHAEWAVSKWERRCNEREKSLAEKGGWKGTQRTQSRKDALGIDAETRWKFMGWFERGVDHGGGESKL